MANVTYPKRINPWTVTNDFTRSITRQTGIPLFDMLTGGAGRLRGNRPYAGSAAKSLFPKPKAASAAAARSKPLFPLSNVVRDRDRGAGR